MQGDRNKLSEVDYRGLSMVSLKFHDCCRKTLSRFAPATATHVRSRPLWCETGRILSHLVSCRGWLHCHAHIRHPVQKQGCCLPPCDNVCVIRAVRATRIAAAAQQQLAYDKHGISHSEVQVGWYADGHTQTHERTVLMQTAHSACAGSLLRESQVLSTVQRQGETVTREK